MRENPSFLEKVSTFYDIVYFGWNVAKFSREVDYDRRDSQLGELATSLVAEVEAGSIDPIAAEDEMNKLSRPQPVREAMLTDRRAERASIRLSRLVESGHIDPVVAEGFIDSGLNPCIFENIKNELIEQGAIDIEAYKNPERHYPYLV